MPPVTVAPLFKLTPTSGHFFILFSCSQLFIFLMSLFQINTFPLTSFLTFTFVYCCVSYDYYVQGDSACRISDEKIKLTVSRRTFWSLILFESYIITLMVLELLLLNLSYRLRYFLDFTYSIRCHNIHGT